MKCFSKVGEKIGGTLRWLVCDPKRLMKVVVLLICCLVVIFQFAECFGKLKNPPIATHSHFVINDTMVYPSITFCREPAYKTDVMAKYNLAYHPKYTSAWRRYPFSTKPLDELFDEATFNEDEYFILYGLNRNTSTVKLTESIHFNLGRCITVEPLVETKETFKEGGYSIMLQHNLTSAEQTVDGAPGWHVFIHETKEPFTEKRMKSTGRVEYLFVEVGEEIEIKVTAQQFTMMDRREQDCNEDPDYSYAKCGETCHWRHVTADTNCSGPWMPDMDMAYCDNYESMLSLIQNYNKDYEDERDCDCQEPCYSVIYSGFAMQRKEFIIDIPSSHVWLYYSSKLVTIIEERPGYDLSQFIADMGGSLGFLLGLSVLGFIGIMEKIITILFLDKYKEEEKGTKVDVAVAVHSAGIQPELQSKSSETTLELPVPLNQNNKTICR